MGGRAVIGSGGASADILSRLKNFDRLTVVKNATPTGYVDVDSEMHNVIHVSGNVWIAFYESSSTNYATAQAFNIGDDGILASAGTPVTLQSSDDMAFQVFRADAANKFVTCHHSWVNNTDSGIQVLEVDTGTLAITVGTGVSGTGIASMGAWQVSTTEYVTFYNTSGSSILYNIYTLSGTTLTATTSGSTLTGGSTSSSLATATTVVGGFQANRAVMFVVRGTTTSTSDAYLLGKSGTTVSILDTETLGPASTASPRSATSAKSYAKAVGQGGYVVDADTGDVHVFTGLFFDYASSGGSDSACLPASVLFDTSGDTLSRPGVDTYYAYDNLIPAGSLSYAALFCFSNDPSTPVFFFARSTDGMSGFRVDACVATKGGGAIVYRELFQASLTGDTYSGIEGHHGSWNVAQNQFVWFGNGHLYSCPVMT